MSDNPTALKAENNPVEEVGPEARDFDHGEFDMGSDDGSVGTSSSSSSSSASAPSKYAFYHPLPRTAQSGFVVRLDTKHQSVDSTSQNNYPQSSEPYEVDDLPALSPIEELEDDFHIPRPGSKHEEPLSPEQAQQVEGNMTLERRSQLLFSRQHLELILAHPDLSARFTSFLRTYRPDSVPILVYLLDSVKALKAIRYAEAIIKGLETVPGYDFTKEANGATMSWVIEDKADRALEVLVKDDLPAFLAYVYVRTVDLALVNRVTRKDDPGSRSLADGLAEVFVLSDPAQSDNPIVFASEGMISRLRQFTSYPRSYALGRNCRFLGGPKTDPQGVGRFRASLDAEREHCEVLLNYRKDGTPFINLIMCVPLRDQYGKVRYFLGAQLDITGLVLECTELGTLQQLVEQQSKKLVNNGNVPAVPETHQEDAFEQLSETFNPRELETLLTSWRRQHPKSEGETDMTAEYIQKRVQNESLKDSSTNLNNVFHLNGGGNAPPLGFYQNYLLVRPYPSLRILFASPDLRVAGILQAPLMSQIGGSSKVRNDLANALEIGRKVTAKVQWMSKPANDTRARWIHCTPLLGVNSLIAVWMVILVNDDDENQKQQGSSTAGSSVSDQTGSSTAAILPWDSPDSSASSDARRHDVATGPSLPNASQPTFAGQDGKRPRNPIPTLSEKSRLGKERPHPDRLPSDALKDLRTSVITAPFAPSQDTGYNVSIWSENKEMKPDVTNDRQPKPGTPRTGQAPDGVGSNVPHLAIRPGPRISGKAYSFDSNSEHGIAANGEGAHGGGNERPLSRSGSSTRNAHPPIHNPGQLSTSASGQDNGNNRPPTRKTYKSLSPYGILFDT